MSRPWRRYVDSVGDIAFLDAQKRLHYLVHYKGKESDAAEPLWDLGAVYGKRSVWVLMGPYSGRYDPPGRVPIADFGTLTTAWAACLLLGLTPEPPNRVN